jgi:excisionase family DNA binding protein
MTTLRAKRGPRPPGKSGIWTPAEVARGLACSDRTIAAHCDRGLLPCYKVGRHRRILDVDLVSYVARQGLCWSDFLERAGAL